MNPFRQHKPKVDLEAPAPTPTPALQIPAPTHSRSSMSSTGSLSAYSEIDIHDKATLLPTDTPAVAVSKKKNPATRLCVSLLNRYPEGSLKHFLVELLLAVLAFVAALGLAFGIVAVIGLAGGYV